MVCLPTSIIEGIKAQIFRVIDRVSYEDLRLIDSLDYIRVYTHNYIFRYPFHTLLNIFAPSLVPSQAFLSPKP